MPIIVLLFSSAIPHMSATSSSPNYSWIWDELSVGLPGEIVGDDSIVWGNSLGPYYNSSEINQKLLDASSAFPDVMSLELVGKSYFNQSILAARLTLPSTNDRVYGKIEVIVVGGIHAIDAVTIMDSLILIDTFLYGYSINDPQIMKILRNTVVYVVPTLNPDGLDNLYRNPWTMKNMHPVDDDSDGVSDNSVIMDVNGDNFISRTYNEESENWVYESTGELGTDPPGGVDLALNFDYKFGKISTSVDQVNYAGSYPFSEPETQGWRKFVESHNFLLSIASFSGGQGFQIPDREIISEQDMRSFNSLSSILQSQTGLMEDNNLVDDQGNMMNWMYAEQGTIGISLFVYSNPLSLQTSVENGVVSQFGIWDVHNPSANKILSQAAQVAIPAIMVSINFAYQKLAPVHSIEDVRVVDGGLLEVRGNTSSKGLLSFSTMEDGEWTLVESISLTTSKFVVSFNISGYNLSLSRLTLSQDTRSVTYFLDYENIKEGVLLVSPHPFNSDTDDFWKSLHPPIYFGSSPPAQVSANYGTPLLFALKQSAVNIVSGILAILTPFLYVTWQRKKHI